MFWFDFNWQIQHFLNQFFWPINFLLIAILVIIGYLSYKKPAYAAGLTIILLPTYLFRSQIWFIPITFLELCIWLTFLGWLIRSFELRTKNLELKKFRVWGSGFLAYKWPILLILLAATISVFMAPDKTAAAGLWKAYFIEPILLFLVLINIIKTEKDKETILWSLGISTLAISFLAIYQKFTGFGIAEASWIAPAHRRVTSIFTSPNAVGLYLGPILAIYFGWILAEIKNYKATILKLLIIIPTLLAVLFTVSQGTWLGLAAAIVFLSFFACPPKPDLSSEAQRAKEGGRRWGWNKPPDQKFWRGSKKWTTIIILVALITCLIIPLTRHRALELITFADTSGQNRLVLLQMSWQYLLANPANFIFGAGLTGFAKIQNQLREPLKMEPLLYPHNIFINFWLEIGLLGLFALIWLIIKFFKKGFTAYSQPPTPNRLITLGLLAAMITIIIHGLIDVPYFKNDLVILFWVIISLI